MHALEQSSVESVWVEDPEAPPHLILRGRAVGGRSSALVTVDGRPVLVLPDSDGDGSGLLRAIDLATGTTLPDRSMLRYERHEVLAVGGGRLLATLGPHRNTVVVRDAVTGVPVGVPVRAAQQPRSLGLTLAGGRPAVVITGGGVAVHDVASGELVRRHERINGRHLVTYRGRLLLIAEETARTLRAYDVLTGEPVGHPIDCDFCMSVHRLEAVEHDGRLLVAFLDSHRDTQVSLWDVTAGVPLATVPAAEDVRAIGLAAPEGRPLLLAARSGNPGSPVLLWDPVGGREVFPEIFAGYDGVCRQVVLGGLDDGFYAVTLDDGAAELWVRSAQGTRRTALTDGSVWRVAHGTVDGRPTVALGGSGGDLRLFDVRTGREFDSPFYGGPVNRHILGAADRDGRPVVILDGRPLRAWDVAAGVPVARLNRPAGGIARSAAGMLHGRRVLALVAGARDTPAALTVWDPSTDVVITEVPLDPFIVGDHRPGAVAFTEIGGRTAVAVVIGRTVHAWDAATGEPLGRPYRGSGALILALAAGRIGDRPVLALGGRDRLVHVIDPASGDAVVPPVAGHSESVTAVALGSADGRSVVVSSSGDTTVRAWDAATGVPVAGPWNGEAAALRVTGWNGEPVVLAPPRMWRLRAPAGDEGHTGAVRAVAAGRWDGIPVFASGGADRTVRVWDAATGRPLGTALTGHAAAVTHVVFAGPDRDVLITGDESGVVLRRQVRAGVLHSEPLAGPGKRVVGMGTAEVDGRGLVGIGTTDGTFHVWEALSGEPHAGLRTGAETPVRRADLGVLDGRLVALTMAEDHADDGSVLTLWDVAAGVPLTKPVTVPEESADLGTLATVSGRLVVVHGIDAGGGYHPEEAADVQVIDVATGTVLRHARHGQGWSRTAAVAPGARGPVVLVAAEHGIAVIGLTGSDAEYDGHRANVTCVAATEVAGRTVVASGDSGNALRFWDPDTLDRGA
ncbi:WD40 repeat domain-containing protein [Actinoplanes sp. NPDC049316]|uniref:WD40 repeat domain-containing protein n=1 Tax=Actinoplanes sp. NPDC049316 TaxID=3154727 RepID=UPI003435D4DB